MGEAAVAESRSIDGSADTLSQLGPDLAKPVEGVQNESRNVAAGAYRKRSNSPL
jgi:hypothetical protein